MSPLNTTKGPVVSPSSTYRAGITLIESIVSIILLSIAIGGPITLAAHSIKAAGAARNEMIATHLAEEGLEVIHSLRDNNSADDATATRDTWLSNASGDIFFTRCRIRACVVDVVRHQLTNVWNNSATVILCDFPACAARSVVYFNPGTGLYRQAGGALGPPWVRTKFTRTITMTPIDHPTDPKKQMRVTATVTYPGYGGRIETISLSEDLYNWFPNLH